MSTPVFDSRAFAPAALERERKIVEYVRTEIAQAGRFHLYRGRLYFKKTDGRSVPVSMLPGSDFAKLVGRVVGVSARSPLIKRALDVIVADAARSLERP